MATGATNILISEFNNILRVRFEHLYTIFERGFGVVMCYAEGTFIFILSFCIMWFVLSPEEGILF